MKKLKTRFAGGDLLGNVCGQFRHETVFGASRGFSSTPEDLLRDLLLVYLRHVRSRAHDISVPPNVVARSSRYLLNHHSLPYGLVNWIRVDENFKLI